MTWLAIGVGGALGAMARHGVYLLCARWPIGPFPVGIFLVNVAGSFLIGLVAGGVASLRLPVLTDFRLFLMVGVLGGFTTFSSFSLDTLTLLRQGHTGLAAVNVVGQVVLSLAAAAAGYRIAS
jgi:CrcB protein